VLKKTFQYKSEKL